MSTAYSITARAKTVSSSRFQPGEGPSRGLLSDSNLRMELFQALVLWVCGTHDPEHDAADGMDINTAGTGSITYARY